MKVSFVIPVRDDARHLERCLASVHASAARLPYEIIVVDNGSQDDSVAVAVHAGARVIEAPGCSVAVLRNLGAESATGDVLAFVDADHEIDNGWTAAGVRLLGEPSVTGVGSQYHAPAEGTWVQRTYDRLRRHQPGSRPVPWLPSGNLMVRTSAFKSVAGFDASLETCEDVDFCQRLRQKGGRLLASDEMRSVHRGDPRTLKALFLGELWRGRDNLRVSLRGPLNWASAPSLVFPVLYLTGLLLTSAGLVILPTGGWRLLTTGLGIVSVLTCLRTAALLWPEHNRSAGGALQAMLVGAVYDAARALALVSLAGHGLRRKG